MDIHTYPVELWGKDGQRIAGEFVILKPEPPEPYYYRLALKFAGRELVASDSDYFAAMCAIRRELEKEGLIPYCYGASRNVYPSGMGRDMGSGLKAYQMVLGRQAKMDHLVFIFDSGPDVEPVSVDEQEAFVQQWFESIKG
jgi:hypothetical protein